MKKIHLIAVSLLIPVILVFTGIRLWGGTKTQHPEEIPLTKLAITQTALHLGEVRYDSRTMATFKVENTGNHPLILKAVEPSCGCTNVKWSRHPIPAGQSTEISLIFEPTHTGKFIKSISIFCNTKEEMHTLTFDGIVKE